LHNCIDKKSAIIGKTHNDGTSFLSIFILGNTAQYEHRHLGVDFRPKFVVQS
jgi:hypothetical protein